MKYTTILHNVRKEMELSINEYAVADSIYHLSHSEKYKNYINKTYLGDFFNLDRKTIGNIISRLIKKEILNEEGNKTTEIWNNLYSENFLPTQEIKNSESGNFLPTEGELSSHNIYNIIYNNINQIKEEEKKKIFFLLFGEDKEEVFFLLDGENNKSTDLGELTILQAIEVWNSVEVSGWKKVRVVENSIIIKTLSSLWKKLIKEYTKEDFYSGIENYIKEIKGRKPSSDKSDYCFHRFGMYEFLKQANGLKKFILN